MILISYYNFFIITLLSGHNLHCKLKSGTYHYFIQPENNYK